MIFTMVKIIFDKVLLEPTFVSIYFKLCFDLDRNPKSKWKVQNFSCLSIIRQFCKGGFVNRKINTFSGEYRDLKQKRKVLGLINLIGELFNNNEFAMPLFKTYYSGLVKSCDELEIEYLCKLVTKSGKRIMELMSKPDKLQLVSTLQSHQRNTNLPSRIRFSIQNIFELMDHNWNSASSAYHIDVARKPQQNVGCRSNFRATKRIVFNPKSMLVEFVHSGDKNTLLENIKECRGKIASFEICKAIMLEYIDSKDCKKPKIKEFAELVKDRFEITKSMMCECVMKNSEELDDIRIDVPFVDTYLEEVISWFKDS